MGWGERREGEWWLGEKGRIDNRKPLPPCPWPAWTQLVIRSSIAVARSETPGCSEVRYAPDGHHEGQTRAFKTFCMKYIRAVVKIQYIPNNERTPK